MTKGTPLTEYWRTPSGAIGALPMSLVATVRMPNCSCVLLPPVTLVSTVYIGWAPIWYGHQTCGCEIVCTGNVTVVLECAATVMLWLTVIGVPPDGGVMVAVAVPVLLVLPPLVTSAFTVSLELLRSAALLWTTCALPTDRALATSSWIGNWMPVLLSGGSWFQSTSSSVSILDGSFGYISTAREFLPDLSTPLTSKLNLV